MYGFAWLNESLPAFTSADYVVAPFAVNGGSRGTDTADETLSAATLLYETDLACEPANIIPTTPSQLAGGNEVYNITNSQGFNMQIGQHTQGNGAAYNQTTGSFQGYCHVDSPPPLNSSQITTDYPCGSPNASYTFLAIWQNDQKNGDDESKGLLAAFCKPTYYSQLAYVTVFQQNLSIKMIAPSGNRAVLDPLAFNHGLFEDIVGGSKIDQAARVSTLGLGYEAYGTVPTVIGIGLARTAMPHSQLPQSNNFGEVIATAYRLMFSLAAQTQMSYNKATIPTSIGRGETVDAVVMNRIFAIVIEVLLAILAAIAVLVLVLNAIRPNKLQSDPHSMAYSMALSSSGASQPLLNSLAMHEMATASQLDTAYRDLKFILKEGFQSPIRCISLLSDPPKQSAQDVQDVSKDPSEAPLPRVAKPASVELLSLAFGIPFTIILAVLIVALAVLKFFSGKYNGKQLLSLELRIIS